MKTHTVQMPGGHQRHAACMRIGFTSSAIFTSLLSFCVLYAQQKPIFRARVDLVQLDVTVLDKTGAPVKGLTQNDFVLLEDKAPQAIQGFTAIDLPDRVIAGPKWADAVTPDVTTNDIDNARIFVLVIDDGYGMGEPNPPPPLRPHFPDAGAIRDMKKTAELFVNTLGPKDLAAVVFTGTTAKYSQNLTQDRPKLIKAINMYPDNDNTLFLDPGTPPKGVKPMRSDCLAHKEIVRLMGAVVGQLGSLPDRRKSIVYFGGALPWSNTAGDDCGTYWMWHDVFAAAAQGSVTINPIQTAGLGPTVPIEQYLTVAGNTGGHAIVNTNDYAPGIKRIFLENSSYYLLAYQPTHDAADGTFRQIKVTVKGRPDLEIVTKRNYWAPRAPKPGDPEPLPSPEQVTALAGLLPDSRLPLRVSAAAFAVAGADRAVVTLALGIRQRAFAARTQEQVDLLVRSFTTTGDPQVGDDQSIPIAVPAAKSDRDESRYEILARIEVAKPGPYHLRLSAHSTATDVRGSVYIDVEVPDFAKDKVSLSGVVINNALRADPVAPARILRDVVPVVPTSQRTFTTSDIVTAFMRVYQGGADKLSSVPIKTTIVDAAGKSVFNKTDTLAADAFGATRAADFQFRVPLATLKSGEYLLTFETTVGKASARRDVRFAIR